MKNLKSGFIIVLALILISAGIVLFTRSRQNVVVTAPPSQAQIATAKSAQPVADPAVISGEPVNLSIPSLAIDLSVIPGVYNESTQQWTLTADKAQYAVVTPQPNNTTGNTFIYGHYRKGVFATLHTIQPGAEAVVQTANGKIFTYRLSDIKTVSPDDSAAVFNYQGAPILTIQTCSGLFFQNRQLFTFTFEKVA